MSPFEHPSHSPGAVKRARWLRSEMNLPERKLWEKLRKLNLHFRRQAPIGRYVADFAQHSARLVIEVDGEPHRFAEQVLRDEKRDAWLKSQGYRVIRVDSEDAVRHPQEIAQRMASLIKALPLNGEGLGWGVAVLGQEEPLEAVSTTPPAPFPHPPVRAPQSPTLSPSRGKGE